MGHQEEVWCLVTDNSPGARAGTLSHSSAVSHALTTSQVFLHRHLAFHTMSQKKGKLTTA